MIVITGASRGVGKFLFEKFQQSGKEVIGTYNNTKTPCLDMYKVDISDFESVSHFIGQVQDRLTDIVLINCAGISYTAVTHRSDPVIWKKVLEVNVLGTYNMIRLLLPIMRQQGYGRIINFSSVVALHPTSGVSAYAASKSAVIGMTKSIAVENSKFNITANTINLGYANIGMGLADVPEEFKSKIKESIPKHRFCEPDEILRTIEFIIDTEYVTGTGININGGLY